MSKLQQKKIFHEFFRYFHVSYSGWKYIPWKCFGHHIMVRKLVWQKAPTILDLPQIYSIFKRTFQLQSIFSHVWSTRVDLNFLSKESPNFPLHNANFKIFISYMVPEIFVFSCTETVLSVLKISPSIQGSQLSKFWWRFFLTLAFRSVM